MADVLVWIEAHPGLASYIQMIGSLATLGLAFWLPHRQRRSLERAAALELRAGLRLAACAVISASQLFSNPEEEEEGPPCEPPEPHKVAKELARACARLESISLQHLRHDHATLLQELQKLMERASDGFCAWNEGDAHAFDDEEHAQSVYSQIVKIYRAIPETKDADIAPFLTSMLAEIEEAQSDRMAGIRRVTVKTLRRDQCLLDRLANLMTKRAA